MLIIISAKLMCNTWQIQLAIMFAVVLPSSDLPSLAGENQFSDKKSEVILLRPLVDIQLPLLTLI